MNQQDAFHRIVDSLNGAMLDEALGLPTSALIDEALGSKGNHLVFSNQSWNEDIDVFFMRFCYRGEHHTALERKLFTVAHHHRPTGACGPLTIGRRECRP